MTAQIVYKALPVAIKKGSVLHFDDGRVFVVTSVHPDPDAHRNSRGFARHVRRRKAQT